MPTPNIGKKKEIAHSSKRAEKKGTLGKQEVSEGNNIVKTSKKELKKYKPRSRSYIIKN